MFIHGCCAMPVQPAPWYLGLLVLASFFGAFVVFLILAVAEVVRWWKRRG